MNHHLQNSDGRRILKASPKFIQRPELWGFIASLAMFVLSGNLSTCHAQSRFATQSRTAAYHPTSAQLPTQFPKLTRSGVSPGNLPDRLEQTSLSACSRGLMSASDFLFYQSLARDARLSHRKCSKREVQIIWQHYQSQIQQIAKRLNMASGSSGPSVFEQESCAIRFALAESAVQIAQLTEDSSHIEAARLREIGEAERWVSTVRQRMNLGLASPFELASAEARLAKSRQLPLAEQIAPWTKYLAWQSASFNGRQSGAINAISSAQLSVNALQLENALDAERLTEVERLCTAACQFSEDQFAGTLNSVSQPNLALPQLVRSLVLRDQMLRLQEHLPAEASQSGRKRFDADWSILNSIAASTTDRRGRIGADCIAVELCHASFSASPQD
ncbi:hypothetical protein AB1L42_18230 [Thalassoglobus sp. JC818]|uniref:hypothetical protein n=1 Tax=Thalassoglobus sp. JC818 TaxID=3232136 RepID=UPI003457454D